MEKTDVVKLNPPGDGGGGFCLKQDFLQGNFLSTVGSALTGDMEPRVLLFKSKF
jgi:hypothetical protein